MLFNVSLRVMQEFLTGMKICKGSNTETVRRMELRLEEITAGITDLYQL